MSVALAAATRFDDYQAVIGHVRQVVESVVPAGSTVLVASKGDPALLTFDQRTGWHFPRAVDGQYAGFHPADSNDAIARLDHQRGLGARYLVVPATSAWWLEHYPELFAHVRENGRPLFENDEIGWIFELAPRPANPPGQPVEANAPRAAGQQLRDLLTAILPAGATCAMVTSKATDDVANMGLPAFVFRYTDEPIVDTDDAIDVLRTLEARYLVVPAAAREWFEAQVDLARYVDQTYTLVTDQRNVCRIYDLRLRPGGPD